jgi:SOS-response transcriptional repressor LexA
MIGLKPREKKVLVFLRSHVETHGIGPSYSEIMAATGVGSKSGICYIMDTLAWRGFIRRVAGRARGIELCQTDDYHLPDCPCGDCGDTRYLARLKIVQALQVSPPIPIEGCGVVLTNLRPVSRVRRIEWLGGQRKSSPRKSAPQTSPAQAG